MSSTRRIPLSTVTLPRVSARFDSRCLKIACDDGVDDSRTAQRRCPWPPGDAEDLLVFQMNDVEEKHREAAKGVAFVSPPARRPWGYGAELLDPDGHLLLLWDEVSIREKGSG